MNKSAISITHDNNILTGNDEYVKDEFIQEMSSSYKETEKMALEILKLRSQLKTLQESKLQAEVDAVNWKNKYYSEEEKCNRFHSRYQAELMDERSKIRSNFERLLDIEREKCHQDVQKLQKQVMLSLPFDTFINRSHNIIQNVLLNLF